MMDITTDVHNNVTASGAIPVSADRRESLLVLSGAFTSIPIIAFILTIIVVVIAGLASRYQVI